MTGESGPGENSGTHKESTQTQNRSKNPGSKLLETLGFSSQRQPSCLKYLNKGKTRCKSVNKSDMSLKQNL